MSLKRKFSINVRAPEEIKKEIKILKENSVYRIADVFYRKGLRWEQDRETIMSLEDFDRSILRNYLQNKEKEEDWAALRHAIAQYRKEHGIHKPSEKAAVLHMRLGDIACDEVIRRYKKAQKMYKQVVKKIKAVRPDFTEVEIVTAMHFGADDVKNAYYYTEAAEQRSFQLVDKVYAQFYRAGIPVQIRSSENIDHDFAYMTSANIYVRGQTNFSDIVAACLDDSAIDIVLPRT